MRRRDRGENNRVVFLVLKFDFVALAFQEASCLFGLIRLIESDGTVDDHVRAAYAAVRQCLGMSPDGRAPLRREILEPLCRGERGLSHGVAACVAGVTDDHELGIPPRLG